MSILEPVCPQKGGDRRHDASATCPFVQYDILSDNEGEASGMYLFTTTALPLTSTAGAVLQNAVALGYDAVEIAGVRHDVQAWHELGHEVDPKFSFHPSNTMFIVAHITQHDSPLPSKDLRGISTRRAQAARAYVNAMQPMTKMINMLVEEFFPKDYLKLKSTERAGRWVTEANEGCFLGLATVWKLQVDAHIDSKDYEICAITCGGSFNGGHLHLPDLNVSFR